MKKLITFFCMMLIFSSYNAFSNGLSLNSPGPKGLGMGGAMVGLADDYTAVYWNPAGITNINNAQIGLFVTDIIPIGTYKTTFPAQMGALVVDATTKTNHYIAPNIMGYVPLMSGDLTIGLSAYVPSGLGAEWDGADLIAFSAGKELKWSNEVGVVNISPTIAYKISDKFSVGAAMNIYYGMLDMERPLDMFQVDLATGNITGIGEDGIYDTQYTESSTGMGYGLSLGLLYKPVDMISIGVSFKTKTTVKMEGDADNMAMETIGGMMGATLSNESEFERDLSWPTWIGGGIAVKPIDKLTLCLDFQYSLWSDAIDIMTTTYSAWPDMNAQPPAPPLEEEMPLKWEDCLQIRFGAEYELANNFDLRFGLYHDPAPAPDETLTIIFPSISYNGLSLGCGYQITECLGMDFGIEYLIGTEREITWERVAEAQQKNEEFSGMPGLHNMNIIAASLGFSYTFKK